MSHTWRNYYTFGSFCRAHWYDQSKETGKVEQINTHDESQFFYGQQSWLEPEAYHLVELIISAQLNICITLEWSESKYKADTACHWRLFNHNINNVKDKKKKRKLAYFSVSSIVL